VSAGAPGAKAHDSSSGQADPAAERRLRPAPRRAPALRAGLALLGAAGALLLISSTFATVVQIKVLTVTQVPGEHTSVSGSDLHGPALAILGAFALLVVLAAMRGARAAMLALLLCGVAAAGVAALRDGSRLNDTGSVGQQYDDATAGPATGFYLETLGGVLLITAGGGLLLVGPPRRRTPGRSRAS
jgi:peptidoglycan/LPS O-acetylase OafA/YrhL